jgi:hypothetical protein
LAQWSHGRSTKRIEAIEDHLPQRMRANVQGELGEREPMRRGGRVKSEPLMPFV